MLRWDSSPSAAAAHFCSGLPPRPIWAVAVASACTSGSFSEGSAPSPAAALGVVPLLCPLPPLLKLL